MSGQGPDFREIVDALNARVEDVARRYAPGGHVRGGQYTTPSPLREDKHAGSFVINLTGSHAGRFYDYATRDSGDMLDLIQGALNLDRRAALQEAKAFLGMADETPAARKMRLKREHAIRLQAEREAADTVRRTAKKRRDAQGIWMAGQAKLGGTPAAKYLDGRSIGIHHFKRTLNVLRYHPALRYYHVDQKTGEVFEGEYPAIVAAVHGPAIDGRKGEFYGVHRIYLQEQPDGTVTKAPVPEPKKIFGSLKGGYIRLWSGFGPKGGKGAPLSKATGVALVCEGIEDGLSIARAKPEERVLVAITLGNIREMQLPKGIHTVVICADNDPKLEQVREIEVAAQHFRSQGRRVSVWNNTWGGKDFNDALRLADQDAAA